MKYFILFITTFFFTMQLYAQRQKLQYDIAADKQWIDSVKKVVKENAGNDAYAMNYLVLLKYFNSCVALGKYYETLYDSGRLQSKRKAIFYYEKVTDFGAFPYYKKYFKPLAIRNNLCRKLAAMYFTGDGIKKNWQTSLELALQGSSGYDGFFEYYSKKYFGYVSIFLKQKHKPDYKNDIEFEYKINPFAFNLTFSVVKNLMKPDLEKIAKRYKVLYSGDTCYKLQLEAFSGTSAKSQAQVSRFLDAIKEFFVNKSGMAVDHVSTNIDFNGDERSIWISTSNDLF